MRADKGRPAKGNRNKQTPCHRCGKPAYGNHCRPCMNVVMPMHVRLGGKRHQQARINEPVVITQVGMPSSSWWTEANFAAAFARELPRLLTVKVSGNPGFVNTVLD
jgi:ribosomal protein L37E